MNTVKNDIHYEAEKFLDEYLETQANTLMTERILNGMLQVILVRAEKPQYFCGFKSDGRTPVWSYDIKFAKSINYSNADTWTEALLKRGDFVLPIWNGVKPAERGLGY